MQLLFYPGGLLLYAGYGCQFHDPEVLRQGAIRIAQPDRVMIEIFT